jgi:transposase
MGTRETDQPPLWIAASDLPASPGHPFYARLNAVLDAHGFDRFAEEQCRAFYAKVMGGQVCAGPVFRLLVGYFEGIDAERGIAWRAADSLAVRSFVRLALQEAAPDHTTISRTRRLIDVETHRAVFTWVQQRLVEGGLLKGKTVAIDATTLEANAAMRSIVRRDTEETYQEFLTRLAKASGIETPTREDLARLDRRRQKKTSNKEWTNPHDPDAKVTKMKDGRTHLAHKAEHAVDLETGAIVAVTVQGADEGDTTTIVDTVTAAVEAESKRRRPTSTTRSPWKRSSPTRGITAIGSWWNSTPSASAPTSRSPTAVDATGRRNRRPKRRCMAIAGGRAADGDAA